MSINCLGHRPSGVKSPGLLGSSGWGQLGSKSLINSVDCYTVCSGRREISLISEVLLRYKKKKERDRLPDANRSLSKCEKRKMSKRQSKSMKIAKPSKPP